MNDGRGKKPYTLDGRTQCLQHWARDFNIPINTVRTRLERGDDLRTALTAERHGDGYRSTGDHGILAAWSDWIASPVITENNLT